MASFVFVHQGTKRYYPGLAGADWLAICVCSLKKICKSCAHLVLSVNLFRNSMGISGLAVVSLVKRREGVEDTIQAALHTKVLAGVQPSVYYTQLDNIV